MYKKGPLPPVSGPYEDIGATPPLDHDVIPRLEGQGAPLLHDGIDVGLGNGYDTTRLVLSGGGRGRPCSLRLTGHVI